VHTGHQAREGPIGQGLQSEEKNSRGAYDNNGDIDRHPKKCRRKKKKKEEENTLGPEKSIGRSRGSQEGGKDLVWVETDRGGGKRIKGRNTPSPS